MIDILAVGHAPILQVNRSIYRSLAKRGWNIELAIPDHLPWPGPDVEPPTVDDPPVHTLAPRGKHMRYWTFDGLADLVKRRQPSIALVEYDPDSRIAWQLGGLVREYGGHVVCQTNENDLPALLRALKNGQIRAALRSLRSRCLSLAARSRVDHVFAICNDGVAVMESLGFRGRTTKIPLGFDPELFHPYEHAARERVRGRLGLTRPTIAYFGRLAPNKGVHLLIEALGRLRDLEWQFLLDDVNQDNSAYVIELTRLLKTHAISDRTIQFHARHSEMPDVMNAADIVVAPSIWKEQYGRVVPESMACGCAVIVSDIGAMPELLGECGLKTSPGDISELEGAIRHLLVHPVERSRLGALAANRARANLSLLTQANIIDSVLNTFVTRDERQTRTCVST